MTENLEQNCESEDTTDTESSIEHEIAIDPLAAPFRVVIRLARAEMSALFDEYWDQHKSRLIAEYGRHLKKGKGGKPNTAKARKRIESAIPAAQLYGEVLQGILSEDCGGNLLFIESLQYLTPPDEPDHSVIIAVIYYKPKLELKGEIDWRSQKPQLPTLDEFKRDRIDQTIRESQTFTSITESPVAENYRVLVDSTATIEGVTYPSACATEQWWVINEIPITELREGLIGAELGAQVQVSFPASALDTVNGGKTVDALITIREMQEISSPNVDDLLAQDAGFDNLEALYEAIQVDYDTYTRRSLVSMASESIMRSLLMSVGVPVVPEQWLQRNLDAMVKGHIKQHGGNKLEAMKAVRAGTEAEMLLRFKGQVYYELSQELGFDYLAKMAGIEDRGTQMDSKFQEFILRKVVWRDDVTEEQ